MFDFNNCTLEEFWVFVASHLEAEGIGVTLVGGAVATVYSKGQYESGDIDMVFDNMFEDRGKFENALNKIGIVKQDQRNFRHSDCIYTIEAKSPPISIGHIIEKINPEKVDGESTKIKLLSPTDCIKDRLYKADEWADDEAFDAAIAVAREVGFNDKKLKNFCQENDKLKIYDKFKREI